MKNIRESGFHLWIILVIIAVIGILGLLVWRLLDSQGIDLVGKITGGDKFGSGYQCEDKEVSFTSPPMKLEDLGYIRPLGAMFDSHVTPTDHVYVGPVDSNVPDNTYPVLMPADGKVVDVGRMPDQYIGDGDFELPPEDHRITLMFSCRYFSIYIHIHALSDEVKKVVGTLQPNENKQVSIPLKAGDTVGYIGGSTFDWTPIDVESKLTGFINPDHYKNENWKLYTVSPFDLYTGELKAQLEAKSWRSTAPIGGKIDYDQPGKLIGNWFREGTNGYQGANSERYWDGHLSVVPDYIVPTFTIVSIGNWNGKSTQFVVDPNVDPAAVSAESGVVKMQLRPLAYTDGSSANNAGNQFSRNYTPRTDEPVAGTILFQVLPGEKLKVEKFIGKTPDQVNGFTSGAETYER